MTDLPPEGEGMPDPEAYGRAIPRGLGLNLLVGDVAVSLRWQVAVLGAEVVCWDRDFAIVQAEGATWMLHQDRTYARHPLTGLVRGAGARGAGAEFRLYGRDPDAAVAAAERLDAVVLEPATDKPHGVCEAFLIDPDGYCWVPTVPRPG